MSISWVRYDTSRGDGIWVLMWLGQQCPHWVQESQKGEEVY